MELISRIARMSAITAKLRTSDVKVGLVSTMGAIHPGHISLIQTARKMADVVVVSIFVNRLQFLSDEEYRQYPRDITRDVDRLRIENVDYVFTPAEEEMYPPDFSTFVEVEHLGDTIPGLYRNAFFRGMTTSMMKLLHIIRPLFIFLGQKDGLQGAALRKMLSDMNSNAEVVVSPVVRDSSGLAYAARNYFLSEAQREKAGVLYRSLQAAETAIAGGETQAKKIIRTMTRIIETESEAALEYAVVADPATLKPLTKIDRPALVGVGAIVGKTPLNDSLLIDRLASAPTTDIKP
jgi:pantoate--beta-alanine ligase